MRKLTALAATLTFALALTPAARGEHHEKDIVDTAVAAGQFKTLATALQAAVVPGKVTAADVVKLKEAKTVEGQSIKIDTADGVKVDGANVVKTDIMASNGVIHVIDSVILPQ